MKRTTKRLCIKIRKAWKKVGERVRLKERESILNGSYREEPEL